MPKKHPAPKMFLKKTMSQVLLLSASPLSNKKTLVDIYPQNHKKKCIKAIIHTVIILRQVWL